MLHMSSAPYHWLIGDDVDTTTTNKKKSTYDRIVVYGERMLEAIVPDSAIAYNFERELNLTEEETKSVSNHYPVEVELELEVELEVEVEQMVEQMRKLELKQRAQRKRNPVTPSTGGRPQVSGAQKKTAGPAVTKGKGV
ncbi:hypothetical protein KUCAC02_013403 [Chaenocephalus aceratus]|nr:hypothetical protein KUCAC02_013403 [Chaenocephalus aceratus]